MWIRDLDLGHDLGSKLRITLSTVVLGVDWDTDMGFGLLWELGLDLHNWVWIRLNWCIVALPATRCDCQSVVCL